MKQRTLDQNRSPLFLIRRERASEERERELKGRINAGEKTDCETNCRGTAGPGLQDENREVESRHKWVKDLFLLSAAQGSSGHFSLLPPTNSPAQFKPHLRGPSQQGSTPRPHLPHCTKTENHVPWPSPLFPALVLFLLRNHPLTFTLAFSPSLLQVALLFSDKKLCWLMISDKRKRRIIKNPLQDD